MTSTVDIQETADSLRIVIKPKPKGILKFGMWFFYTIPIVVLVGLFFYVFGQRSSASVFNIQFVWMALIFIGGGLFIIASLRKIYEKEIITVTDKSLVLKKEFLFKNAEQVFKKEEITDLKVLGRQTFTKHPLDTNGFDYLGMGTAEKEVQFLIEDGKIGFQHNGLTLRFGKNIWEEDGVEIIDRIKKYWR
jgi:predicted membrane protein